MWRNSSLRAFLVADELDVVDQQHVGGAEALLERHRVLLADRLNELVHETFGREVENAPPRLAAAQAPCDRVHEVGLAEADAAVEIERVEGEAVDPCDLLRRGMGELVGLADHEFAEGEAAVERRAEPGRRPVLGPGGGVVAKRLRCVVVRAPNALAGLRRGRMNRDPDALDAAPLAGPERGDAVRVVGGDPVAQEAGGDAEGDLIAVDVDQNERRQPTREGGLAHFRAKLQTNPLPGLPGVPARRPGGAHRRPPRGRALRRPDHGDGDGGAPPWRPSRRCGPNVPGNASLNPDFVLARRCAPPAGGMKLSPHGQTEFATPSRTTVIFALNVAGASTGDMR